MAKQPASEETVNEFMRAVYPTAPNLATMVFDEETVLQEAIRQLNAMREAIRQWDEEEFVILSSDDRAEFGLL